MVGSGWYAEPITVKSPLTRLQLHLARSQWNVWLLQNYFTRRICMICKNRILRTWEICNIYPATRATTWHKVTGIKSSQNGFSPLRCQAITWTNTDILSNRPLERYVNEFLFDLEVFSQENTHENVVCKMFFSVKHVIVPRTIYLSVYTTKDSAHVL